MLYPTELRGRQNNSKRVEYQLIPRSFSGSAIAVGSIEKMLRGRSSFNVSYPNTKKTVPQRAILSFSDCLPVHRVPSRTAICLQGLVQQLSCR